jgi:hypothetical protein
VAVAVGVSVGVAVGATLGVALSAVLGVGRKVGAGEALAVGAGVLVHAATTTTSERHTGRNQDIKIELLLVLRDGRHTAV